MRPAALLALTLVAAGCRGNVTDPEGAVVEPPALQAVSTEILLPGSTLLIQGDGFLFEPAGTTRIELRGRVGDAERTLEVEPFEVSTRQLRVRVGPRFAELFGPNGGQFEGRLAVVVQPGDQAESARAALDVTLRYAPAVAPRLEGLEVETVAPGALVPISGDGLLDGEEGRSELVLSGVFKQADDAADIRVSRAVLPLRERLGRTAGSFYLGAFAFPLEAGVFQGQAVLRTVNALGATQETPPREVWLEQRGPAVRLLEVVGDAGAEIPRAARGQILRLRGRGLLPNDPVAQTATLVHARGTFRPLAGEAEPIALTFIPEQWLDDTEVRLPLRTTVDAEGRLTGLGARPGRFEGEVEIELHAGARRVRSAPAPLLFEIEPPTQWVRLRYLPGFRDSLDQFGLLGAEQSLRSLILAVCHRHFAGLRIHFTESPPTGWAEYVTVEIGGRDPNGIDLFGLDNTPTKDVGNLKLDELLGGRNAETENAGSLPFGGIFVESFLTLSPRHPDPSQLADPRFDAIFADFSPALSASAAPYRPGQRPEGARAQRIEQAVRALANLIGSTISHEVGHALGLAATDRGVHNPGDAPRALMDSGINRPFLERAGLDDQEARFLPQNRAYLESLFGEGGT